MIDSAAIQRAVTHLLEARYCRRLDMWTWEGANRAVAHYRKSAEFEADEKVSKGRPDKLAAIIAAHARSAFAQGLTTAAAMQIGLGAGNAARISYAAQPLNGPAAQAQAKLHAEKATTDARATGVEPTGLVRHPNAAVNLLHDSWHLFVASAQCLDPAHLDMHDALASCLEELTALVPGSS